MNTPVVAVDPNSTQYRILITEHQKSILLVALECGEQLPPEIMPPILAQEAQRARLAIADIPLQMDGNLELSLDVVERQAMWLSLEACRHAPISLAYKVEMGFLASRIKAVKPGILNEMNF